MDKYFVYAIKSETDNRIYVGMSKNPDKRLSEHNNGETKSTKGFRPWHIIYKKFIGSRIQARQEEKRLKSGSGKEFLKSLSYHSAVAQW
jgi:putative endonuclease